MDRKRILFVHAGLFTFTKIDLELLRSVHEVREVNTSRSGLLALLRSMLEAVRGVFWAEMVFAWFGGYHALLPFLVARLLGKPCIVVASGYDVAAQPEISYGNMRPGLRRQVGRTVFALATRVLAVSRFTAEEVRRAQLVPEDRLRVVTHGVPALPAALDCAVDGKQQSVLTVARISRSTITLKGIHTFLAVARQLPAVSFVLVGPSPDGSIEDVRAAAPPNVQILGPLYGDDLIRVMCAAKVYVQLSAYESFGMALAEAMLCGAIPVVTDRGALPEVIGDCGESVPYGDTAATTRAVERALAASDVESTRSRERIRTCFPLDERRVRLLYEVEDVSRR